MRRAEPSHASCKLLERERPQRLRHGAHFRHQTTLGPSIDFPVRGALVRRFRDLLCLVVLVLAAACDGCAKDARPVVAPLPRIEVADEPVASCPPLQVPARDPAIERAVELQKREDFSALDTLLAETPPGAVRRALVWIVVRSLDERSAPLATAPVLFEELSAESDVFAELGTLLEAERMGETDAIKAQELIERQTRAELSTLQPRRKAIAELAQVAAPTLPATDRDALEASFWSGPSKSSLAIGLKLGKLRAASTGLVAHSEAARIFYEVYSRGPLRELGIAAKNELVALAARAPGAVDVGLLRRAPILRARALLDAFRYDDALRELAPFADATDPATTCEVQSFVGRAKQRLRKHREAAVAFDKAAEACAETEVKVAALFNLGRSHFSSDQDEKAIAAFETLIALAPQHRLADDAGLRIALAHLETGDVEKARTALLQLLDSQHQGDMRNDAAFELYWTYRAAGDPVEALAVMERYDQVDSSALESEGELGRIAYWHAVALQEADKLSQSADAFFRLQARYPLSFYGHAATEALHSPGRGLLSHVSAEAKAAFGTPADTSRCPTLPAVPSDIASLLQVDEARLVSDELRARRLLASDSSLETAAAWSLAFALYGAPELGVDLARARHREIVGSAAFMAQPQWLRGFYPLAMQPLFSRAASDAGTPLSLLYGIAREESGFRETAFSKAHAYGLVQLIEPTAKRFFPEDVSFSLKALMEPENNLRTGAHYLAAIGRMFGGRLDHIPAAYNAGESAVRRWDRERPELVRSDEFVDRIPYEETRRYTRRVLQSARIYARLLEGAEGAQALGRAATP